MRPKGWKNDVLWREHYAKLDAEREDRIARRLFAAYEMQAARDTLNYRISKARMPSQWKIL